MHRDFVLDHIIILVPFDAISRNHHQVSRLARVTILPESSNLIPQVFSRSFSDGIFSRPEFDFAQVDNSIGPVNKQVYLGSFCLPRRDICLDTTDAKATLDHGIVI